MHRIRFLVAEYVSRWMQKELGMFAATRRASSSVRTLACSASAGFDRL